MKHSLPINLTGEKSYQTAISVGSEAKRQILLLPFFVVLGLLLTPLSGWFGRSAGGLYAQCTTSAPAVLAKWDFNSLTTQCNGAVPKGTGTITSPFLLQGQNTYCPNINNGCGAALLGTKGFGNTNDFKNAICLAGFWRNDGGGYASAPGWTVSDVVFHPEIPGNLTVSYILPLGKAGSITSFSLQILQKQFDGTNPSFEKQGVGVYRNGVLIYSQTQPISTSTVNGTAMSFTFPSTPEFTSDGSTAVDFEIVFGLVHRLIKITTGYDNICVIGTCGVSGSPTPTAAISPATCGASSANSDGKITLSNFGAADHYDISQGSSYTGTLTYATSTVIPVGGVVSSTLANPTTPQVYTVRVFTSAGCTTDLQVTLNPTICPGNCTAPTGTVTSTAATCTGNSANNNASIAVSGVTGGDKVAISPGSFYTGPTYSSAQTLTSGAYSFSALPNPNGSQVYTVRIFNGDDNCFKDYFVTLNETACGCKKIGVQVVSSDQADPDSSPNNSITTEDDYASYEVCKGTQFIDLKLAKTVSPTSGSTCPTNTAFVWKMVVTNAGSMSATNIQVSDKMPDNLLITSATVTSGTFTISGGWQIPSLAAGASTTLTITTNATTPGTYTNCAWVSGAFPLNDPNSSPLNDYTANEDDDDCASITVTGANTPTVAKEFSPNSAKTGSPIRLTIKLTNNETTPITLTAAMVDNLPSSPGQMVVAPTPNLTTSLPGVVATAGGTSITIPAGTVLAPGLNQVQVDVTAPVDGEYCNDVLAGALQTTSCANVAGTEACVIVKSTYVMGPLIKKSFSPAIVGVGQSSTLVITIENRNAGNITVLQNFIDDLPTGLVVAGSVTGTYSGTSVLATTTQVGLTTGSLIPPGISTISVPVQSTIAASYCNTIIDNTMIGTVSNGTIQVMTGNDGVTVACLTVSANPCSTIDVTSITPPAAVVAPSGTVSLTVNGTGFGASTLYTWKGTGSFNPQSVSTTYTAPATTGIYTLTVVADNRLTGYGTCKDSTTINVLVQPLCSLTATATASSQTVCQNQSVTLSAQVSPAGSYTYVWAAPAGITLTGANTATATASMSVSGLQTFTVTVSSSPTCSTTATVSVLVNAPTTLPTYQSTTLCEGGSVNFSISPPAGASAYWTTPSNTTISSGTVTIASVTPADGGTYTLYYTNANGCTSSTTKSLIVNAKPTLSLASSGCVSGNQSYTVLLSTNATSLTTNASQLGVTISGNLITVPVAVTSFLVSGSSAAGCVATLPVTAPACTTVCTPPNAGPDQAFCQGPTTTTLVSPGTGEQWSVLQLVNGTNPVINQSGSPVTVSGLTLAGVYKFRLASTSVNNCSAVVTVTINTPTTLPTFSPATACEGQGLTFSVNVAAGEVAYWTTPTNTTISSGTVTIANATTANSGTYTLYYTNATGCVSTTTQSVTINAKPTLGVASSGCTSDGQSYTVSLNTNASSLTTNASQFGVTINGNLITAPVTITSFAVSGSSAAGCVTTLPITAPACATACSLTVATTVGTCATATNTYSATTLVTMRNPAGSTLTVTDGVRSVTFTVPASLGTFTATATFNGLTSDGSSHTVTASLPGCSTTTTTYTAPASCSVAPVCSISAVATAGLCSTATNTFSNTVAITLTNPTAGTLTVTDGVNSITFVVPSAVGTVTTSAIFNGLISDGASHTVLLSLPGCTTTSVQYTAPASCTIAVALTVTPGTCQSATNQYSISGTLSFTNAVAGTATITDGTTSTTVAIGTGDTSVSYSLTGLTSDATAHTVTVNYASKIASVTYTAPASCSVAPCSLSATATVGLCDTATNTYSNTVLVTLTNPTAGTLTVTDGVNSLNFVVAASLGTTTATATFNGLVSDGTSHTVTASLPGCSTTTTTYTAPASCSVAPALAVLVTPGTCSTATNQYSISGTISLTAAVANSLTITDGSATTIVAVTNGQTSVNFNLEGLSSGSGVHTVTVSGVGYAPASTTYNAPASCTVAVALTVTPGTCSTATNQYSISGMVSLTNAVAGTATITDGTASTTVAIGTGDTSVSYSLSGLTSDATSHTVSVSYAGQSTSVTYTAPASCSVAPALAVLVTPGTCSTATNQYSISGTVSLTAALASSLTITDGSSTTIVAVTNGQASVNFNLSGLTSGTSSHTVTVSGFGYAPASTTYSAPASCTVAVALTVTPGTCQSATNQYSISGTLSLTNAVAGTATITDGTASTTVAIGTGDTSVSYSLTRLISDATSHTVAVSYAGQSTSVTYTAPASCTVAVDLVVTPGTCSTLTNQYSISGTLSLTNAVAGIAIFTDGNTSTTVSVGAGTTSVSYSLTGLTSDAASHTVIVSYASKTASVTYTAPASCSIAPVCSVSAVVTAGQCDTATNTYSVTAIVTIQNPTNGTLTVGTGDQILTFTTTANTQNTFTATFNGLVSDGASHAVIASLPGCGTANVGYTAPVSCSIAPVCSISAVTTTGLCATATNTYSNTVLVTMTNPTAGTLTVTDGVNSITFVVAASLGTTTTTATFNGLVSDGASHTVTASLPNCSTTTTTYTAPASCSVAPTCSVSAVVTIGQCATATNTYSTTVVVTVTNPNGGILTVSTGGQTLTFSTTANTQNTFTDTFNGLISDGASHTITVSLPGCASVDTPYTAPTSCSVAPVCSLTATATAGLCATATNTYSSTAVVQLTNPTTGILTITDGPQSITLAVTAASSASFTVVFSGLVSDGSTHTVTASLPGCSTTTTTYSAPTSCSVDVSLTVTPGACSTLTNQYSISGTLSLTNAVAGTATITDGSTSITVSVGAGATSVSYSLTGLPSDATSHTVTVSYASKTASATYTSPASCSVAPICSLTAIASPGVCQSATNTFTNSVVIWLTNPTTGVLTITDGPASLTFATTGSSTSFTATFAGISSDGSSHTVTASLPGCSTTTTTYTAPTSCSVAVPLGSLGDFVWKDSNNNGVQDAGEPGMANITVQLYTVVSGIISSTPIATTVTSASGLYGFNNLPSGQYQVKFTLPASLTGICRISTKPNTGSNNAVDSDVDPATGFSPVVTIDATQPDSSTARNNPTIDMGLTIPPSVTITDPCLCFDVEYYTTEKRELYETFQVTSSTGESWSVVSETGMLALDSLVKHPVLIGTLLTEKPSGSGKYQLSFTHENAIGYSVVVTNGSDTLSIGNVCSKYPTYSTTILSATICRTAAPIALTASSGIPGNSEFFYIDPTTKQRVVITQFDPSQFATGDTITIKLTITPTDPNSFRFTIVQDVVIGADCNQPKASLGDFVWEDNNDNGIQDNNEPGVAGVEVDLFAVVNGVRSSSAISTTVTDASGHYSFPNLLVGDYQVQFSQIPASLTLTPRQNAGTDDALDSDADPTTGFSHVVHLDPSGTGLLVNNPTIDAGLRRLTYDPTGYIYCYKNNTILKGGKISVTGPGSITIVLDGSKGYYRFLTDGTPGSYTLTYSHPNGYSIATASWPPAASAVTPTSLDGSPLDKDTPANGWVQLGSLPNADTTQLQNGTQAYNPYYLVFDVKAGDPYISNNNLPVDCDLPLGSIGDFVWNDLNNNGQQDSGEPGVGGVTIRLLQQTTPGNYTVVSTTVTSASGNYLFPNLPAGTYVVEFDKTTLPTNFSLTTANASGVSSALDSDANSVTGRSGLITLIPADPTQRDILTIDAGVVNQTCPPAKCLPILIRRTR